LAYLVHISDADRAYMARLPLSDRAKRSIEVFIEHDIANVADSFRNDPANRPSAGAPYFQINLVLMDVDPSTNGSGTKCYHKITFIVYDGAVAYGVLVIAYVDHQ
jgi:hypothetical protein